MFGVTPAKIGLSDTCPTDNDPGCLFGYFRLQFCEAKRAAPQLKALCGRIDTLYNERSYDGRQGEDGREDDDNACSGVADHHRLRRDAVGQSCRKTEESRLQKHLSQRNEGREAHDDGAPPFEGERQRVLREEGGADGRVDRE